MVPGKRWASGSPSWSGRTGPVAVAGSLELSVAEIDEARLKAQEDELLEAEKRVLANSEKIYNAGMNAFDLLYEGSVDIGNLAGGFEACGGIVAL